MDFPQLFQAFFSQSPALGLALVIWYFMNRDLLRLLQERREDVDALRAERAQWIADLRQVEDDSRSEAHRVLDQYSQEMKLAYESRTTMLSQLAELKAKMQELISKVEQVLLHLAAPSGRSVEKREQDDKQH